MQTLYARIADERNRLQRELEIATVLQTSLLPGDDVPGILEGRGADGAGDRGRRRLL